MTERTPAVSTSPALARRFGLLVGGVFLALALVFRLRGRSEAVVLAVAAVGGLLVVGGAVAPRALVPVYRAWMGLARLISKVTTPLVMGVVYFVVVTPMGIVRRLAGGNPLVAKESGGSFWVVPTGGRRSMERQF